MKTDPESQEIVVRHGLIHSTFNVKKVRARYRAEMIRDRGVQLLCARCENACPVLRGSPGNRGQFFCFSFRARERRG